MAAETRKGKGLSEEQARAILAKNPKLRSDGKDTSWVLERASQARGDEAPDAKWLALPVEQVLGETKKALDEVSARIDREIAELEAQRKVFTQGKASALFAWFKQNDPSMAAPSTKAAVKLHAELLRKLGFRL